MAFKVYVAAPYEDAGRVRAIHAILREARIEPVSRWAEGAIGPEPAINRAAFWREVAAQNDHDVIDCDAMLVLARDGVGGEMFAELRLATLHAKPVVYVGSRIVLSAWREGVVRVPTLDRGLVELAKLVDIARGMEVCGVG